MSDTQRANNLGRKMYLIVTTVLFIAYLAELLKGSKTPGQFALLAAADLLPVVAAFIVYKMNPEAYVIRHIIGMGYGLFYALNCFMSTEQMVFVYAIPMVVLVSIYCDKKFSITVSILVSMLAIVHGVWYAATLGEWSEKSVAALEIEIAAVVLVSAFAFVANNFIIEMNARKVEEVNEAGARTNAVLDEVMKVSGSLAESVAVVSEKMDMLSASSGNTLSAMNEVQTGTGETANSVQNQLIKTEEISRQVEKVTDASKSIGTNINDAVDAISEGRANLDRLIAQAEVSEKAGVGAINEVTELKKSTDQMESIVQMIQNVASQTSLLALNASIEAARAGEAGRGFAVVASEISSLSSQTSTATKNISDLIVSVTNEMANVAKAIESLVESNKVQNESAQVTAGSFEKIVESAAVIRENSSELSKVVANLDSANREIVESIQTISAITEEVSAHSQTTCEATEQNQVIVEDVQKLVSSMTSDAGRLKAIG